MRCNLGWGLSEGLAHMDPQQATKEIIGCSFMVHNHIRIDGPPLWTALLRVFQGWIYRGMLGLESVGADRHSIWTPENFPSAPGRTACPQASLRLSSHDKADPGHTRPCQDKTSGTAPFLGHSRGSTWPRTSLHIDSQCCSHLRVWLPNTRI